MDVYHNYSGRDYTAAFERLLNRLRTEVPELTDLNHSDAGVSLIRLLARESDQLAFYLDEAFNEGFINTARYKQSLVDLGKLVGYPPKLASPASVTLTLTRTDGVTGDIPIPQYAAFSRSDGKTYLVQEAATLLAAENTVDLVALEGSLVELTVETGEFQTIDFSGLAKYNLGKDVAANTVVVTHGSPVVHWSEVESFWRTRSTDNHFMLELYADAYNDETDTVWLILGGAGNPGVDLTVKFIRTNGKAGNTGYGTITTVPGTLLGLVTCDHTDPATGGAAAEGIESLRERIPRVTRTQRRGVTTSDYEALIESIEGIRHCQCIDRNYNDEWPHMYVTLYVVPEGGGPLTQYQRDTIHGELAQWGHLGDWQERYLLFDATEVAVNVTGKLGITAGYTPVNVIAAAQQAVQDLLSADNQDIAGRLRMSDLYTAVNGVAGVSYCELSAPTQDVQAENGSILAAGTINVTEAG